MIDGLRIRLPDGTMVTPISLIADGGRRFHLAVLLKGKRRDE